MKLGDGWEDMMNVPSCVFPHLHRLHPALSFLSPSHARWEWASAGACPCTFTGRS